MNNEWSEKELAGFDPIRFGERVTLRRKKLGIKQKDLAEKAGVSNSHMSGIEHGKAAFSFKTFLLICLELDVTPDYLLEGAMRSNNVPLSIVDDLRQCTEDEISLTSDFVKLLRNRRENRT